MARLREIEAPACSVCGKPKELVWAADDEAKKMGAAVKCDCGLAPVWTPGNWWG